MKVNMEGALVRDWMTHDVITIASDNTLPEAYQLMKENGIRRLPVIEDSRLVGIITWGDVRQASTSDLGPFRRFELDYLLSRLPVSEIMTRNPITVQPNTTIAHAAQIMMEHKIGGLPVVDFDKLAGIITEQDVFRMLVLDQAA